MYTTERLYDLSFVTSKKRAVGPQIVFAVAQHHVVELERRLQILVRNIDVSAYFGKWVPFSFGEEDLFGNRSFGFGQCGFSVQKDTGTDVHIELAQTHVFECALTIHILTTALCIPFDNCIAKSNKLQQIDIETACDPKRDCYGFAVGGYVSASVLEWLQKQSAARPHVYGFAPLDRRITSAMRATWCAINKRSMWSWAKECGAFVSRDARFNLSCLGNACDVAIYPDQFRYKDQDASVRFGCHNLDTVLQQLTLLAGLAKMCELAREEPD